MRLLIFLYPWLELLSLIQLGVETNALVAIGWVLLMFLLGGTMIRKVGTASVQRLREAQRSGLLQQNLFVDDMVIVVAGLLLIIPGLLSDFFAVVVLIGPLRRVIARHLFGSTEATEFSSTHHRYSAYEGSTDQSGRVHQQVTLEGEYQRIEKRELGNSNESGRTQ